ncbi:MAG TPA: hypothetical protein VN748_13545, partial [Pseudonocardiaceae bacterium]|nr:hypothetical protein [Pseudonocardiaceae bacterium]
VVGLLWMAGILIAMGWFAIGWIARGQENRKYAESRLKYLADQAIDDRWEFLESRARWEAERVRRQPPTVLNVYLAWIRGRAVLVERRVNEESAF